MTLLTTAQAAEQLGVTPAGVRKLVERGKLTAQRFGGSLAFSPSEVNRAKSRPGRGRPSRVGTPA